MWLNIIDIVLILDMSDLAEAIQLLRPNSLVLGKEFERKKNVSGKEFETLQLRESWSQPFEYLVVGGDGVILTRATLSSPQVRHRSQPASSDVQGRMAARL